MDSHSLKYQKELHQLAWIRINMDCQQKEPLFYFFQMKSTDLSKFSLQVSGQEVFMQRLVLLEVDQVLVLHQLGFL